MQRDATLEHYLAEAQSWEIDRAQRAEKSARWAWTVAASAGVIAAACAAALAALTPLKQPVPVVIRVDSSTGVVDLVPRYDAKEPLPQLVSRHLLTRYVIARESYFYGTAEADYELVGAQNAPALNQEWVATWNRSNPSSPLNLYKDGTTVRVQVRSISFLKLASGKDTVAQVRFTKYARSGGNGAEQATHWISTIEFGYARPSSDDRLRSLNPLGFRVVEYRREPEVVGQPTAEGATQ